MNTQKTLDEFMALVEQMRAAQTAYFAGKGASYLSRSKELERRVDQEIVRIRDKQKKLF